MLAIGYVYKSQFSYKMAVGLATKMMVKVVDSPLDNPSLFIITTSEIAIISPKARYKNVER